MPDLGDTRATLTLDASGFVSGSQQAQAALSAIDESGQRVSKSSATIETHLSSVGAALMAAGASGDGFAQKLQAAAAAADAANARVDGLTIKTQAANAALTDAQSALDGSAERLAALKEALNIDTDNLTQMRAELEQMQASGTASAGAIQMLKDGIAELESDAAALNGQIETATQVDNANAAAVDKASAKYAQLAAQMTQAQLSANKTNTTLTNLTSTLNSSGSGAASIGGMVQSLGSMGSSTLTMASRELSNMAVSATGLSTATVQGRLASAGLSTGLNVLVKSLGAASMGYLALGAAAFAGTYKLMESAVDARNVSKALDTVIKDAANDNYTAALSDVDVTLSDEDGIKTTILEKIKNIIATLTDGETDTIEIVVGLKADITEENSALELQIDQYFTDAINAAETPEAKAALQKQWDAVKSSLTDYTQGEIGFIETYAGKSTEICQEAAGELEEIYAQVEALVGGLQTQTELLNGQYGDAYDKVSKGYYASEQDIEYALTFVQANEQNSKAQAMEARNAALNALNDAFRGKDGNEAQTVTYEIDGTKYQVTGTFNELTHSIETQYQTDMNAAEQNMLAQWDKMINGIINSGTLSEEATAAAKRLQSSTQARGIMEPIMESILAGEYDVSQLIGNSEFFGSIAQALGNDRDGLMKEFSDFASYGDVDGANAYISSLYQQIEEAATTDTAALKDTTLGSLLASALESNIFEGIEGIDTTEAQTKMALLIGQLFNGGTPVAAAPTVEVEPVLPEQPIAIDTPINVPVEPSLVADPAGDGKIREAVKGMAESAKREYNTELSNTDGTGGAQLGQSASDSLNSTQVLFTSAGNNAGSAFVSALSGWAGMAAAASAAIGGAAYSALKRSLQINSPSRKMRELGGYTGMGFALGISDKIDLAEMSAKRLSGATIMGVGGNTTNNTNANRSITINMQGTTVRSDNDIRTLTRKIGQAVNDAHFGLT